MLFQRSLMTMVHESCSLRERHFLWDRLLQIQGSYIPWLCGRDFNGSTEVMKKLGGRPPALSAMSKFMDFILEAGIQSLHFSGSIFTWCNVKEGDRCQCSRLDRVLVDHLWMDIEPKPPKLTSI
ncbi:uncharacterized protein M6B38_267965 [Iris pallida]|uniref:Uncharacterized protein n=1 Tax=Iris pallida TaxID=29817 RepID=A0AAX6I9N9_IRIPA|nr:uncharacterized protein M6B38_267965 [Iris pallida]